MPRGASLRRSAFAYRSEKTRATLHSPPLLAPCRVKYPSGAALRGVPAPPSQSQSRNRFPPPRRLPVASPRRVGRKPYRVRPPPPKRSALHPATVSSISPPHLVKIMRLISDTRLPYPLLYLSLGRGYRNRDLRGIKDLPGPPLGESSCLWRQTRVRLRCGRRDGRGGSGSDGRRRRPHLP